MGKYYSAVLASTQADIAAAEEARAAEDYAFYTQGAGSFKTETIDTSQIPKKFLTKSGQIKNPNGTKFRKWLKNNGYEYNSDTGAITYTDTSNWVPASTDQVSGRDLETAQIQADLNTLDSSVAADIAANELSSAQSAATLSNLGLKTGAEASGYELTSAQNAAALGLLPQQTALEAGTLAEQQARLEAIAPIREKYYQEALSGTDPTGAMNRSQADVQHAYGLAQKSLASSNALNNVDPNSGAAAVQAKNLALGLAKDVSGARTAARVKTEDENYAKLKEASSLSGLSL